MQKPFIYLFKYLEEPYFFDVNKNKIVRISSNLFDFLVKSNNCLDEMDISECDNSILSSINSLIENGYLSSNKASIIEHPLTSLSYDYLENNLRGIVLQISQNCNLKCRYCIYSGNTVLSRSHNNLNMSWDVAQRAIDFFTEHSTFTDNVQIGFYGGEPMLDFELIKQSVQYIENRLFDKTINYSITTNGTIFTDDIIAFFEKYNFNITISLDGPEEIHNTNRRFAYNGEGSYSSIVNNLSHIKNNFPKFYQNNIQFNSVVEDISNWEEIETFFMTNDLFKNNPVSLGKVSDTYLLSSYSQDNKVINNREKIKFQVLMSTVFGFETQYFGDVLNEIKRLRKTFSLQENLTDKIHPLGQCMPGHQNLFVDIYGDFRICEKASEKSPHMKIGDIYHGFDYNSISNLLNIGKMTETDCLNCHAIRHCRICAVTIDGVNELSIKKRHTQCSINKREFQNDLHNYILYKKMGLL